MAPHDVSDVCRAVKWIQFKQARVSGGKDKYDSFIFSFLELKKNVEIQVLSNGWATTRTHMHILTNPCAYTIYSALNGA